MNAGQGKSMKSKPRQDIPYDSEAVDLLNLDLSLIMQRLKGCNAFLSLIELQSKAVLLHLNQVHDILDLQLMPVILGNPSRTLTKHVEFLINSPKNLLLPLQRRSQTQLYVLDTRTFFL